MARPRKTAAKNLVVTESKGAPEPEHDTRDMAQEDAPVSVEVNDEPVAVEEDEAESVEDEVEKAPADLEENESEAAEGSTDVLFASEGISVHILMNPTPIVDTVNGTELYDVRGQVLRPGDTVPLDSLPPYQKKAAMEGTMRGAQVVTAEEAFRLNREAAQIRAIADQTIGVESDMVTEVINPVSA
jgi:hypothetical protein